MSFKMELWQQLTRPKKLELCLGGIQQLRGPRFTQFWPPSPLSDPVDFLPIPSPPLLVHVVIECPLIFRSPKSQGHLTSSTMTLFRRAKSTFNIHFIRGNISRSPVFHIKYMCKLGPFEFLKASDRTIVRR